MFEGVMLFSLFLYKSRRTHFVVNLYIYIHGQSSSRLISVPIFMLEPHALSFGIPFIVFFHYLMVTSVYSFLVLSDQSPYIFVKVFAVWNNYCIVFQGRSQVTCIDAGKDNGNEHNFLVGQKITRKEKINLLITAVSLLC